MNRIYIYNSLSGTGDEFLAAQLSNDPTFYPLTFRKNNNNGRYEIAHPLRYFDINNVSPQKIFEISDSDHDRIDEFFSAKSLIIPIKYTDRLSRINLPRLSGIRINFTLRFSPLFYTLSIIENGVDSFKNTSDILNFIDIVDPAQQYIHLQNIKNRGHYYNFERDSILQRVTDPLSFVKNNYMKYIIAGHHKPNNYVCFQLDNLLVNPKDTVKEFCNLVGRESVIDYKKIEEFHTNRILTLEKTFNKSYKDYVSGNWKDELVEWVRHKCC
jgi:hypothetical protein